MFAKETGFELAAPCGLYCGNCEIFRAYKDDDFEALAEYGKELNAPLDQVRCEGCRTEVTMFWCPDCEIKGCCEKKGVSFCFECDDFPCVTLIEFQQEAPHHSECIESLERMAETDIRSWLEEQDEKWRCALCRTKITYYTEKCPNCSSEIVMPR
ncbi:MAG: DUF3795 domain-containing protein [Thermoplasmata archaeon]